MASRALDISQLNQVPSKYMDSLLSPVAVHCLPVGEKGDFIHADGSHGQWRSSQGDHTGLSTVSHNKERETEKGGGW
jgi:hypothetical protein